MASYDDTATVSGSIVRVNDGADSVGLKNWLVTLPASLSGYSEVNAVRSGKNILPNKTYQRNANTLRLGTDTLDGRLSLKAGTYTLSITSNVAIGSFAYTIGGATTSMSVTSSGTRYYGSFTLSADTDDIFLHVYKSGGITSENVSDIMLEVGSTATSYEAYEAPTQYTAELGRTIYGGQADIVTGEGENGYHNVDLGSLTWTKVTSGQAPYFSTTSALNPAYKFVNNNPNCVCSNYTQASIGSTGTANGFYVTNIGYLRVRDDATENMTADEFKTFVTGTKLVYELDTPTPFTFTPITAETSKGSNTFWSEQGDSEVTYYKDGYGFTSVTIHKETPEGEPVEQTAKLHKIVYGGLVDVIQGKAEPKNLYNDKNLTQGLPATTIGSSIDTINTSTIRYSYNGFVPPNGNITISAERNDTNVVAAILFYGYKDGLLTDYRGINPFGTNPVTIDCSSFDYVRIAVGSVNAQTQVPLDMTDYGYIQAEVGSSKSDYSPYFDPFSFPPISMETDEGENTLYADEGDSAIVYRKAVE